MSRDRTIAIDRMETQVRRMREELTEFIAGGEAGGDDVSNADRYDEIELALDNIEGMIGDLVP